MNLSQVSVGVFCFVHKGCLGASCVQYLLLFMGSILYLRAP